MRFSLSGQSLNPVAVAVTLLLAFALVLVPTQVARAEPAAQPLPSDAAPRTNRRFAEPNRPGARVPFGDKDDQAAAAQRRREADDLRREDVASQLALLGVPLKWQDHGLPELLDWRDRIEAAVTLRVQYRVDVDWRVTSLRDLIDMRLRAAKASELSSRFGVRVDWRRYSWVALESLRRQMSRTDGAQSPDPIAGDALATPGSVGRPRRPGAKPRDPDAIIEPTFAFDTPLVWSRPFGHRVRWDPDAILVPTFVTLPSPPLGPDDVIDPWNPPRRSTGRP